MVVPLVTAIDAKYFPGLAAMYNSYKANAGSGFEFFCIVDGDAELFARVESLGIKTIKPTKWVESYPTSPEWPEEIPSLFADLQIPRLFPNHERAIWIDADCIIVKSLAELIEVEFDQPIAACTQPGNPCYSLDFVLRGCPKELRELRSPNGGLVVFNVQEWNSRALTEKCAEVMQDKSITFRYGDQSVLAYVMRGEFFALGESWQGFPGRKIKSIEHTRSIEKAKILHWLGGNPWIDEMPNTHIWQHYADM